MIFNVPVNSGMQWQCIPIAGIPKAGKLFVQALLSGTHLIKLF